MFGLFLSQLAMVLPGFHSTFLQSLLHCRSFIPAEGKVRAELPPHPVVLLLLSHGCWVPLVVLCRQLLESPIPAHHLYPTGLLGMLLFCLHGEEEHTPKSTTGEHTDTLQNDSKINCR